MDLRRNLVVPLTLWFFSFLSLCIVKAIGRWDLSGILALIFFLFIPSVLEKSNEVVGFKFRLKENLIVFLIGFLIFSLAYLILFLVGRIEVPGIITVFPKTPDIETLKWFFIFLVGVALPEEFFFRGFIQGRLNLVFEKKFKIFRVRFGYGLLISSILFMLIHIPQDISVVRFLTFFPGLLFGFLREKYGSIFPSVIIHAMSNTFAILVVA